MNNRNFVRYDTDDLAPVLAKVTLSWEGVSAVESSVANYSARGMNVVVSLSQGQAVPTREAPVQVRLPKHKSWLDGTCIHVESEGEGSIRLGLHFGDEGQQRYLQNLLFNSLKHSEEPQYYPSYQWEELVTKLCGSDNPELKKLGRRHLAGIRAQ